MSRIRIPLFAKSAARKALKRRKKLSDSEKFGLSKAEAKKKGITSGVARAEQLIRNKTISREEAKRVKSFIDRFEGFDRSSKVDGAINLWGGRRFDDYLERKLKKK